MKNAVYGQSGGPTSVINASFYGVLKQCKEEQDIDKLFIMHNGIKGLIDGDLKIANDIDEKEVELLPYTPGAICGSVRYKLKKHTESLEDYNKILEVLKKNDIHYIFLNGGNDSMDTLMKLTAFFKTVDYDIKMVGVPKTIDNDLVITDHTPGFGSAAKFIINTVKSIFYDNETYSKGRVNIVEIMGRDAGWLTASSYLASLTGNGPDLIYVPEVSFDKEQFLKDVNEIFTKNKRCLVAVSEGVRDSNGEFIAASTKDAFNHAQLGGVGATLSQWVKDELNLPTRAIELSLMQRCFGPSIAKNDDIEAIQCGREAVKAAVKGESGVMVTMIRDGGEGYNLKYSTADINLIANEVKYLPAEFINASGNNITESFVSYCLPLVSGDIKIPENNGIACYANKSKF